jgi:tRNA A-37 threonylcarbamoyl transferase component Bud32
MLVQYSKSLDERLVAQILRLGRHIARSSQITAACVYGDCAFGSPEAKTTVEVLVIIRGFQPKLMNYVRVIDERNVLIVAVDEWVFERDVDRGFLGEALVWGLIFPHLPLINEEYLRFQEVKLKRRLILELLENIVLDFPELSHELRIRPEYFMYEAMLSRVRLFPPMIYSLSNFMREGGKEENVNSVLSGYLEALNGLKKESVISFSDGYVGISERFVNNAQSPRIRLVNISKAVPRTLFASFLGILPRVLNVVSQNREMLFRFQRVTEESKLLYPIEAPEKYVYVPTSSGLVSLADKTDIEAFARKALSATKDAKVKIQALGGILNDVYLVKASVKGEERKFVVKRFRDWSSFKWFPLLLWSVGTRTFAVLGRSRLEKECSINQFLNSKGFDVPKLLHVSPEERLVFMEYVEGENASRVIKRYAASKSAAEATKGLKIIERIGRKFAKVHALGIALGDTKPENIMIGKHSEIYLMDFEQASRNGDKVWDVAELLYYAGHDLPPIVEARTAELLAQVFIKGYLAGGGNAEIIRKAANPKYTKVFSVFTFPHIMLAISNVCRKADELKE